MISARRHSGADSAAFLYRILGQDRVEGGAGTTISLSENPEAAREPIRQPDIGITVGGDSQTDRGRGPRIGGAVNTATELLAQHPRHQRQA